MTGSTAGRSGRNSPGCPPDARDDARADSGHTYDRSARRPDRSEAVMSVFDVGRRIRRVGLVSMHTSPLAQPGDGDAGGLNTYVTQTARHLAARGIEVEILTRATRSDQPCAASIAPGVLVRHVPAGPFEALDKRDLPGQLCTFAAGAVRLATGRERPGY